ncbi:MAG: hypothetical protein JWQ09_478 [Segetibacter sp.]|nr:hypothetical protein [Segetibacter sp.]
MNKLIVLLSAFVALTIFKADASDSCQILFNKQVIFKSNVEQENAIAFLKARQFKNTDCITIAYHSESANKGWKRTFYLTDSNDQNLKSFDLAKQSGSACVKASVLNEMKKKKQPVFVYTISLPTDKAMAARIRVRRIFICKIEWN